MQFEKGKGSTGHGNRYLARALYCSPPVLGHHDVMAGGADAAAHWDDAYAQGDAARSWFQRQPVMSLQMLDAARVTADDSVIDIGGGASSLAGALLGRGFGDITVLDISATAMQHADHVQWLAVDLLTWEPRRRYRVWHDRAVFHFRTAAPDRRQYLHALDTATEPNAIAVFGCFARTARSNTR